MLIFYSKLINGSILNAFRFSFSYPLINSLWSQRLCCISASQHNYGSQPTYIPVYVPPTICSLRTIMSMYSPMLLICSCLRSLGPAPCTYMHLWELLFLCQGTYIWPTLTFSLLMCLPSLTFWCKQIWMEIQTTPNEPRYWVVLKPGALNNIPSLLQHAGEGGARVSHNIKVLYGIYDPRPSQRSLPPLALFPLGWISKRRKQTNYEETNTTSNKYVLTWRECFQQDTGWVREMEGSEVYNLHLVSPLFCALHFPLISSCLAVPSTLCDLLVGLSEEINSNDGQCGTDGQMMGLTW